MHIYLCLSARKCLDLIPDPISISGANENVHGDSDAYKFIGRFMHEIDVFIGDVRTDAAGRLIVGGGFGHAGHSCQG